MINLTINGVAYPYPETGDKNWGTGATNWASAVTTGMLSLAGGSFSLTAEVDFGLDFGLKALYFLSETANPSGTGVIRLANTDGIGWRNIGHLADILLKPSTDGLLQYNSIDLVNISASQVLTNKSMSGAANTFTNLPFSSFATLTSGNILVGSVANVATSAAMSGDVTIVDSGATTVGTVGGSTAANIHSAELLANAATNANTVSTIVKRDGSGDFSAGVITAALTGTASGNTTITPSNHAVVVSGAANTLSTVGPGTTGTVLKGSTGADPAFGQIVNADIDAAAAIVDTKLATISTALKVSNSATTATSANTNSAIVARDGSGNFSAGTITATLSGNSTNVSGTVAIANGGTGQTAKTDAFDALSPTTTKGDIIASNGSDNIRVAVGADGLVLTADAASTAGVKWSATATGDVSSNTSSSVDSEIALFSGTGGKTIKRATGTGLPYITSGVLSSVSNNASTTRVLTSGGSGSAPSWQPLLDNTVVSTVSNATNWPINSGEFGDLTSISLTAGTWEVSACLNTFNNGAVTASVMRLGVGTTSGNNGPNTSIEWSVYNVGTTLLRYQFVVSPFRLSVGSTTTYYLKGKIDVSAVNFQYLNYIINARQIN